MNQNLIDAGVLMPYTFSWDCEPRTDYFTSYNEAWASAHGCDQSYGQQFPQMEEDNTDYTI